MVAEAGAMTADSREAAGIHGPAVAAVGTIAGHAVAVVPGEGSAGHAPVAPVHGLVAAADGTADFHGQAVAAAAVAKKPGTSSGERTWAGTALPPDASRRLMVWGGEAAVRCDGDPVGGWTSGWG